jgi:beta-glucosidase
VATSDWQWNPADSGSDWGYELGRAQRGQTKRITGVRDTPLPAFDRDEDIILPLAKGVGSNAIRVSFDFGKLCPQPGVFREDVMARYVHLLARCHVLGMEPIATLHHWTMPKSFATFDAAGHIVQGPLEHLRIVEHFQFYARNVAAWLFDADRIRSALVRDGIDEAVIRRLTEERRPVSWFISLNEPVNMLFTPYFLGLFPPYQRGRLLKIERLKQHLRSMHALAYDALHEAAAKAGADAWVGMAHHVTSGWMPFYERFANWGLLEAMERDAKSDFIGIQHYHRLQLGLWWKKPFLTRRGFDPRYWSDDPSFGQIHPAGIHHLLMKAARRFPKKPLLLSEFGFADRKDEKRPEWILDAVEQIIRAKNEGADLRGALLWSLTDNFEWNLGMDVPFGLFDRGGHRLQTDDAREGHVSSREAWTLAAKHLAHPTPETAAALLALRERTHEQLNRSILKIPEALVRDLDITRAA